MQELSWGTHIVIQGLTCQMCGEEAMPLMVPPMPSEMLGCLSITHIVLQAQNDGRILCNRCEDISVEINQVMGGA